MKPVEELLSKCGITSAGLRGAAFLAGVSAFKSSDTDEFHRTVELWSSAKSQDALEQNFGSVRDLQIVRGFEDYLYLIKASVNFRSIETEECTISMYNPAFRGVLRETDSFSGDLWDSQLLYNQLVEHIGSCLTSEEISLSAAFDCGLFYHILNHQPVDKSGASEFLDVLRGAAPPIYKGIFLLSSFPTDAVKQLTPLHLCLLGFTHGLGQTVEQVLWASLSYVLYDKNGNLDQDCLQWDAETFIRECHARLPIRKAKELRIVDRLQNQLNPRDDDLFSVGHTDQEINCILQDEYSGFELLAIEYPVQASQIFKIVTFYEYMRSMLNK